MKDKDLHSNLWGKFPEGYHVHQSDGYNYYRT